jgi:hypothetical protein
MEKIMDSEKLQKLANLAIVRQHAAAVTASTNFNRKFIADMGKALGVLDNEFAALLNEVVKSVGGTSDDDAKTIAQRLAEEKAKLNNKVNLEAQSPLNLDGTVKEEALENIAVKSETRPAIKTTRAKKDK